MLEFGDVWLADLNAAHDAEPLRIRAPAAGRLPRRSDLLMDQVSAIDNRRLVKGPLLRLSPPQMKHITTALSELIGADD